ncbi:MAG: T9SS type A sorting domain-containing protein [Saprospiraceae bacterium]|nr:T9SS type A sorting domain-containing protein [Saprospiraceae bacterium]
MKEKNLQPLLTVCCLLIAMLVGFPSMQAQITINSSDILGLVGSDLTIEEDSSDMVMVGMGSPGANQVYDFTGALTNAEVARQEYILPSATPYASSFPNANLAQRLTPVGQPDTVVLYLFFEVTNDFFKSLGFATQVEILGMDTAFISNSERTLVTLPLTFGNTWISVSRDTTDILGSGFILTDSTVSEVDGWGSIQLPEGSFDCLRLRSDSWTTQDVILNGAIISSQTTFDISYAWITENSGLAVQATSQDGETDPNFNNPVFFSRVTGGGITSSKDLNHPEGVRLLQNFPNPFKEETQIIFELDQSRKINLSVHDLAGKVVRELADGVFAPGKYSMSWDGNNDQFNRVPAGIYYSTLKVEADN